MIPLTAERAPKISTGLRTVANTLARGGDIVILGRAVPWNEYSLGGHKERILPGAFGTPPHAPPLLAEHTTQTRDGRAPVVMATGIVAENTTDSRCLDGYGTGGGLDVLWTLNDNLESIDWLFSEHLANGNTGLSVEMRVYDDEHVREGWAKPDVRHVKDAIASAVAVVRSPSYLTARIQAIVTPEVSWYMHPGGQVLVPDVEPPVMATVHAIDYRRARSRARDRADIAAEAVTQTVLAENRAHRTGRDVPPLELRKAAR